MCVSMKCVGLCVWRQLSSTTFNCVPELGLSSPDMDIKHLYVLSRLTSPPFKKKLICIVYLSK